MKQLKKTITLYDAGGLIIVYALFGLPLGVIFDYFWNLLVFSVALPRLPGVTVTSPGIVLALVKERLSFSSLPCWG